LINVLIISIVIIKVHSIKASFKSPHPLLENEGGTANWIAREYQKINEL